MRQARLGSQCRWIAHRFFILTRPRRLSRTGLAGIKYTATNHQQTVRDVCPNKGTHGVDHNHSVPSDRNERAEGW